MRKVDIARYMVADKKELVFWLYTAGMAIAFFGSLHPWFMWMLGPFYIVVSCVFLFLAFLVDRSLSQRSFSYEYFLYPTLGYVMVYYYQQMVNMQNIMSYIVGLFYVYVFFCLFRINEDTTRRFVNVITKALAVLLIVSMAGYIMYIFGFPLPSTNAEYGDNIYSYSNYYIFLLDDRSLFTIVPRFHAVFLEPGHLGTLTTMLLVTHTGHWRKWYCIVLIVATLLTFSLAGYVMFAFAIFFNLWIQRKAVIRKAVAVILLSGAVVVGSFFYNDGMNMVNQLIVMRLEMDDGKLSGDNRVTDDFQRDYESFLTSPDVLFGRDMERVWGSTGYKVYIYDYGLFGVLFMALFVYSSLRCVKDRRVFFSTVAMAVLLFIVRDALLWCGFFAPLYCCAKIFDKAKVVEETSINSNQGNIKQVLSS